MVTVASSPRPANLDSSMDVETDTDYLKTAKKGGGHKGQAKNNNDNKKITLTIGHKRLVISLVQYCANQM